MKQYKICHPLMKSISFEANKFVQFTGQNLETKNTIIQVIDWNLRGHKYNEYQMDDLNNKELEFYIDEKRIKKQSFRYIKISSKEDLVNQLSTRKDSVTSDYLNMISRNVDVNSHVNRMNELLELISGHYNTVSRENGIDLDYKVKEILMKDVNQNFFEALLISDKISSFEFADTKILMKEFFNMLNYLLTNTDEKYFVLFDGLGSFLNHEIIEDYLKKFYELTKLHQLYLINISKDKHDILIKENTLDSIIICGCEVEKLYDWDSIYGYIQNNYPTILKDGKKDILGYFKDIIPFLLSINGSGYIPVGKYQILYILLNRAFHFEVPRIKKSISTCKLEENFIEDNLYINE